MNLYRFLFFLVFLFQLNLVIIAQNTVEDGCDAASFGIDGDLYANDSKFGNIAGSNSTDDWFENAITSAGRIGKGVISQEFLADWSDPFFINTNPAFLGGLSQTPNTILNGIRWQDGLYARDYFGGPGNTDLTSFVSASKNGEDPAIWNDGPQNITPKNDIIDCLAHLRRDGVTIDNNLWLMVGFSRISNNGESYLDAEFYTTRMTYSGTNGFSTGGPDEGHTSWKFDAAGKIIQAGDLAMAVNFSTTSTPLIDLRIWVSRNDYNNQSAADFEFDSEFDGQGNNSNFGYASIKAPEAVSFACGKSNSSAVVSPPWGTLNSSGEISATYDENQFIEIGVNLTEFGIDPANSIALNIDPCWNPFGSVLFKARASASFTSQLKDFSGPYEFGDVPIIPPSASGDTISCYTPEVWLGVDTIAPGAHYHWETTDGNILTNPDSSHILVDVAAEYTLFSSPIEGCEAGDFTVEAISLIGDVQALIMADTTRDCSDETVLMGVGNGDVFSWSGPDGFTSNDTTISVVIEGLYILDVFNTESGCSAQDTIYVQRVACIDVDPSLLPSDGNLALMAETIIPTFTVPLDITIDCNELASYLDLTGDVIDENDNCDLNIGEAIFSDTEAAPCAGKTIITRTWSLTDNCGNENILQQIITLADTIAPTFTAPEDITIDCSVMLLDIDLTGDVTDESDNCNLEIGEATYQDDILEDEPCGGGTIISRVWSLTDDCGNLTELIQTITLADTTAPVFDAPVDISISCHLNPNDLAITGSVIIQEDDCDLNLGEAMYNDDVEEGNPCKGASIITRTWTLSDDCGNSSQAIQIITLEDMLPPIINGVPEDLEVACDETIPDLEIGVDIIATDVCQESDIPIEFEEAILPGNCPDETILRRRWIATDDCGNSSQVGQDIFIYDNETPIILTFPSDVTVSCDDIPEAANPELIDNCDSDIEITLYESFSDSLCSNNYKITRVWEWRDNCDNPNDHTQIISVEDNTAPLFEVPDDITLDCTINTQDTTITGSISQITDNCINEDFNISFSDAVTNDFSCDGASIITRTWLVGDDCGNADSKFQIITLIDTIPPTFTVPEDATIQCDMSPSDLSIVGDVTDESDSCTSGLEATYTDELLTSEPCNRIIQINRTWSLSDDCGNASTQNQIITLLDTIAPVFTTPDDLTIYFDKLCSLDTSTVATGLVGDIEDNCSSTFEIVYSDELSGLSDCKETGIFTRTWTVTDECGNSATDIQTISVLDTVAPIFQESINDLTVQCESIPQSEIITAIDACGREAEVYIIETDNQGECLDAYTIQRMWTTSDACGNTAILTQDITVVNCGPETVVDISPEGILCEGEAAQFEVSISPDHDSLVYQWQFSTDNQNWIDIDNASESTYAIDSVKVENEGWYRVIFSNELSTINNSLCNVESDEVQLTILTPPPATYNDFTFCRGDSVHIGEDVYYESGVFANNLTAQNGCDSVVISSIIVYPSYEETTNHYLCEGDLFEGVLYEQDTILRDTFLSIHGCDRIINKNIIINMQDTIRIVVDLCRGEAYEGIIYESNTELVEELETFSGCKITQITEIIIHDTYTNTTRVELCSGEMWNGESIFADTTRTDSLTTTYGCDSLEIYNIDVHFEQEFFLQETICANEEFTLGGISFSESGTYTETVPGINGCDSLFTLELVVYNLDETNFEFHLCEGERHEGILYQQDSVLVENLQNVNGCDSIVNSYIFIYPPQENLELVELCLGQSYNGNIYESDTIFSNSFLSIFGCDSIQVTEIQIVDEHRDTFNIDLCYGEIYEGQTYTEDAVWEESLTSSSGCDSTVWNNITVSPIYDFEKTITLCQGEEVLINGIPQNTSGMYQDSLISQFGCDSIYQVELIVLDTFLETSNITICEGDAATIFGEEITTAGTYSETFQALNGCDSVVNIVLNVYRPSENFESIDLCVGDSILINGTYVFDDGVFIDSIPINDFCDSIVTITINFFDEFEYSEDLNICEGDSLFLAGEYQTTSGTYIDSLQSVHGCDSILTYVLDVHPTYLDSDTVTICEGETYSINGVPESTSGIYEEVNTTLHGCDSIISTELIVIPSGDSLQIVNLCEGETYFVAGAWQTESGVYEDPIPNDLDCEGTLQTQLSFHAPYESFFEHTLCYGDSILIYGNYELEAGLYYDSLQTIYGCDSIITTELIITERTDLQGAGTIICEGDEVQLYLEGSENIEVKWSHSNTLSCDDCLNPIAFPEVSTTYRVTYFDECLGRLETIEIPVTVERLPEITIDANIELIVGDTVIVSASTNDTLAIIDWYDTAGDMVCRNCKEYEFILTNSVHLTVQAENSNGCIAEDVLKLKIDEYCEFGYVKPNNVIFPESNGYGDHWEILYDNINIEVIRVFNRWGQLVFETKDPSVKWDGTFRGEILNPGVFVYYIQGNCVGSIQDIFVKTGNITLIR